MKKTISLIIAVFLLIISVFLFTSCEAEDDCFACGGSGYYQKKDCPFC